MEFKNQEHLPAQLKDKISAQAGRFREALGGNLLSIAVYGSALGTNFIPGKSNINLLLILEHIDVAVLKSCLKLVEKGQKENFVAPLMFTPQHIDSSLDVFPIEFSEISDNHLTIYGEELLENLKIEKKHLRLQCEREIKGKLIHLRQGYLESSLRGNSLKMLLENSLRAVLPLLRAALRLRDVAPPVEHGALLESVCRHFPLDGKLFSQLLRLKEQKKSPPQQELESLLANYLIQLQKLAQLLDRMEV